MKVEKELRDYLFYGLTKSILTRVVQFDAPGSYSFEPRLGVKSLLVIIVGAAGGSGRAQTSSGYSASGGGGGPAQVCFLMEKKDLTPIGLVIGGGGAAGTSSVPNGGTGGTTSFDTLSVSGGLGSLGVVDNQNGAGGSGGSFGGSYPLSTKRKLLEYPGGSGGAGNRLASPGQGGAGGRILNSAKNNSVNPKDIETIPNLSITISGYPDAKGGDGVFKPYSSGGGTVIGNAGSNRFIIIYEFRDGSL